MVGESLQRKVRPRASYKEGAGKRRAIQKKAQPAELAAMNSIKCIGSKKISLGIMPWTESDPEETQATHGVNTLGLSTEAMNVACK